MFLTAIIITHTFLLSIDSSDREIIWIFSMIKYHQSKNYNSKFFFTYILISIVFYFIILYIFYLFMMSSSTTILSFAK
ncbi:hypothetical protein O3M35_000694 [Rhynocoris fuscipes]|uniref:NADH dehydrogenase subunit 6 n=1 Tax=Rhynocoris fuscipes TaxID=488301 RepID=A0AAW1DQE6_9HEMI